MKLITISRLCFFVCLLSCFLFSEFNLLSAQTTTNLTVFDGLPSNTVRCLHKAKNGVLWIGTDAGLCSYDGRDIIIYDKSDGLSSIVIFDITEDEKGQIWVGCYGGGVSYFNGESLGFKIS